MSLYEGIKDVAKIVQQADNIELYRHLLDLSAWALDMQAEINKLKEENAELKKKQDIAEKIIRHKESYITLEGDPQQLRYCAHCWDSDRLLIQLLCESGKFNCPHCKMHGTYDKAILNSSYMSLFKQNTYGLFDITTKEAKIKNMENNKSAVA